MITGDEAEADLLHEALPDDEALGEACRLASQPHNTLLMIVPFQGTASRATAKLLPSAENAAVCSSTSHECQACSWLSTGSSGWKQGAA